MRRDERFRPGPWTFIFLLIMAAGAVVTVLRYWKGLGAMTNLSDRFPWGLWIGFDVLCGVALAAGGFTITTAVYVFNLKRFQPIVRPTVLTAFLGYLLVAVGLMYDLGRPWNIWHPLVMWNPRSPMFARTNRDVPRSTKPSPVARDDQSWSHHGRTDRPVRKGFAEFPLNVPGGRIDRRDAVGCVREDQGATLAFRWIKAGSRIGGERRAASDLPASSPRLTVQRNQEALADRRRRIGIAARCEAGIFLVIGQNDQVLE